MPTFIPDLLTLLRSAEGLAREGPESSCLPATNQLIDSPPLSVVLPFTLPLQSPAAMPTPRRERAEGRVLARAVTAARGRRSRTRPAPRASPGPCRRTPGPPAA